MRHCRRLLTQKDSSKEKSEFEKLVQVCRVARDLYYQENSQENSVRSVFEHVGQVYDKSWGKKPIQEDGSLFYKDEILVDSTSHISREELFKGSKLSMSDIDSLGCSVFDQVGQVYEKSREKKPIQENGALFFNDEILVGCSTSCIAPGELFKGSKTNRGESASARFCKFKIKSSGDDHDYFKGKKVVKWSDDDGDILKKSERLVEPKVFDGTTERKRSRKFIDSFEDDPDCEYSERREKKPRSVCNARNKVAGVAAPLPVVFKNEIQEMGGTDIKLIIQKFLFSADTKDGQQRFSIPMKQIREDFLTDEEEIFLDQRSTDNHVVPMIVPLIEPNLEKTRIKFRKWAVNSSYVLSSPWNKIRKRNALKRDMEMQLWSFRVDGALNMAMVKV